MLTSISFVSTGTSKGLRVRTCAPNVKCEIAVQRMLPVLLHFTEIRGKTIELVNMMEAAIRSPDSYNLQILWQHAKQSAELHEPGFWGIHLAYIYGRLINLNEGARGKEKRVPANALSSGGEGGIRIPSSQ